MSAYMLAQIQIGDSEEYKKYLGGFMPIFERHGGELLATSKNQTVVIEGEWSHPNTVIMKFPSIEAAQGWSLQRAFGAISRWFGFGYGETRGASGWRHRHAGCSTGL